MSTRPDFNIINKPCGNLKEIQNDKSVDIVITSPPYNTGHFYAGYEDRMPREDYLKILKDMLQGAFLVLKADGLCVIDIADEIFWEPKHWRGAEYIINICKGMRFELLKDYTYNISTIPGTIIQQDNDHSTLQHILVFSKSNSRESHLPKTSPSPFNESYVFGSSERNEAYWPPILVDDFISVFNMKNKKIVDPYMGSGLIGLRANRMGCTFIGYEISPELCEEANFRKRFEFGAELDMANFEFLSEFKSQNQRDLLYIGVALEDNNTKECVVLINKYYRKKGQAVRQIKFNGAVKELEEKEIRLLNQILHDRVDEAYKEPKSIVLTLIDKCENVLIDDKILKKDDFCYAYGLEKEECFAIDIHFKLLQDEEDRAYWGFYPLIAHRQSGAHAIAYLTVCGTSFSAKIFHAQRNDLLRGFRRAFAEIIGRRLCNTVDSQRHFARSAAASAILARNMSHNIGSHVIPRARVKEIWSKLDELSLASGFDLMSNNAVLDIVNKSKSRLDDYIRQKSDFLAEFTTEPLSSASTALLYRDVILSLLKNTVLMDCLAANEGISYKSWSDCRLKLRFFSDIGAVSCELKPATVNGADSNVMIPYAHRNTAKEEEEVSIIVKGCFVNDGDQKGVESDNDAAISLPGALGQFALYGIIENIVRNAAKHNRDHFIVNADKDLVLTLRLRNDDKDKGAYRLLIYDSVTDAEAPVRVEESGRRTHGSTEKIPLHEYLLRSMKQDIIEETGQVRQSAWGIAEIVICSNLLAGSSSYLHDSDIVRVYEYSAKELEERDDPNRKRLVFDLKLLRARQALIAGPTIADLLGLSCADEISKETEKHWLNSGIVVKRSADELKNFLLKSPESTAAFQFAVMENDIAKTLNLDSSDQSALRLSLPYRVIRLCDFEGISDTGDVCVKDLGLEGEKQLNPANVDRLVLALWRTWCRRWLDLMDNTDGRTIQGQVAVHLGDNPDHSKEKSNDPWRTHAAGFFEIEKEKPQVSGHPLLVRVTPGTEEPGSVKAEDTEIRTSIFDRHGGAIKNINFGDEHHSSYIAFDKRSEDFLSITQPRFPSVNSEKGGNWSFPYELFEAGQLRILILDERLAESALSILDIEIDKTLTHLPGYLKPYYATMPVEMCLWQVACAARVYITTHLFLPGSQGKFPDAPNDWESMTLEDVSLNALHSSSYAARFTSYMKNRGQNGKKAPACPYLGVSLYDSQASLIGNTRGPNDSNSLLEKNDFGRIDILVVHQGILDTAKKAFADDYEEIYKRLRTITPWIVVESGRGIPPEIQKSNEKFIPFSALDRCFGDGRIAKLMLCKRLMERARSKQEQT